MLSRTKKQNKLPAGILTGFILGSILSLSFLLCTYITQGREWITIAFCGPLISPAAALIYAPSLSLGHPLFLYAALNTVMYTLFGYLITALERKKQWIGWALLILFTLAFYRKFTW
jgi:hypothetical protein